MCKVGFPVKDKLWVLWKESVVSSCFTKEHQNDSILHTRYVSRWPHRYSYLVLSGHNSQAEPKHKTCNPEVKRKILDENRDKQKIISVLSYYLSFYPFPLSLSLTLFFSHFSHPLFPGQSNFPSVISSKISLLPTSIFFHIFFHQFPYLSLVHSSLFSTFSFYEVLYNWQFFVPSNTNIKILSL